MSEEHDVDCAESEQTEDKECNETEDVTDNDKKGTDQVKTEEEIDEENKIPVQEVESKVNDDTLVEKTNTENQDDKDGENASANTSATNDKESLSSVVDEKQHVYEGKCMKGKLTWTREDSGLRVSWVLIEGTATPKDYVALCYAGKRLIEIC